MKVENYDSKPHSPSITTNIEVVAFTTPLYSTFVDESAMALYFLLDYLIGPSTRLNTYSNVEFRSMLSPAQSLLVNPTSSKPDFAL